MKIRLSRDVFIHAAELIEEGVTDFSCNAITNSRQSEIASLGVVYAHREVYIQLMFGPDHPHDLLDQFCDAHKENGIINNVTIRNHRIYALLLAGEVLHGKIVKEGE